MSGNLFEIVQYIPAALIGIAFLALAARQLRSIRKLTHENDIVLKVLSADIRNR